MHHKPCATRREVERLLGAPTTYSPECVEEIFSEVHLRESATLCIQGPDKTPDSTGRAPNLKIYILGWRMNIHRFQEEFLTFMAP
jgi:hypothetical protein